MKYVVDTHSHTLISGHAYNTLSEMAKSAKDKGLEALAVTEHAPSIPGSCQEIYFLNYKAIDRMAYGVELLMGCELNILDYEGKIDLGRRALARQDIVLASMHDLCYTAGTEAENTRAYCKAMENPYVDIIGHPDDGRFPVDYEELARQAKATDTLLELNNTSLMPKSSRINGHENMRIMLKYCEKYGTMVSLGSDAHFFDRVGRFTEIQEVLDELRFPEELVANTSLEKLKKHLHKFQ